MQLPDAIFHLMRNTHITALSLSANLIKRLPSKLGTTFTTLQSLDISHNRLSSLPEELEHLVELESLDMSSLQVEAVLSSPSLEHLNLEENPLEKEVYEDL